DHMEAHQKLIPVESNDEEDHEAADDGDKLGAKAESGSSDSSKSTDLCTPGDDPRETPASLKML
ncbi:MAG: hypothetical protein J4O08_09190, partial [Chloroflexi bacterium]|nr:hypothetical protein [Chloroflexota bacterium]